MAWSDIFLFPINFPLHSARTHIELHSIPFICIFCYPFAKHGSNTYTNNIYTYYMYIIYSCLCIASCIRGVSVCLSAVHYFNFLTRNWKRRAATCCQRLQLWPLATCCWQSHSLSLCWLSQCDRLALSLSLCFRFRALSLSLARLAVSALLLANVSQVVCRYLWVNMELCHRVTESVGQPAPQSQSQSQSQLQSLPRLASLLGAIAAHWNFVGIEIKAS